MPRLTSPRTVVSRLLDRSNQPIYLVDGARRLVYCNTSCAALVGLETDVLIGAKCDYRTACEDPVNAATGQLCPPPQAFAGSRVVAEVAVGDGTMTFEFIPLDDDEGNGVDILAIATNQQPTGGVDNNEATVLHRRIQDIRRTLSQKYRVDRLIGESPAIRQVRSQVAAAIASPCRVVVAGAEGTGRETVARTIHYARGMTSAPLVPLSCGLLDSELLQSTVEAFVRRCADLTEEEPGTLLLLNIDQLPRDAQSALVGLLEISELELITLATASRPLTQLAAEDHFRTDLAHAASTLEIHLPPLSQRPQDIPLLAQNFVEEANNKGTKQIGGFSVEAMDQMVMYTWPGNIDELNELVAQAWATAGGPLIQPTDLPAKLKLAADAAAHPPVQLESIVLDEFLVEIETELIRRALARCKGNKTKAAGLLGISRARLLRRVSHLPLG